MRIRVITALTTAALLGTSDAFAKPPSLTGLFPAGAARGQTVTVDATGTFDHWPVQGWVEGRGVASKLVRAVLEKLRAEGNTVVPFCPFVRAYIKRHPEFHDLLVSELRDV